MTDKRNDQRLAAIRRQAALDFDERLLRWKQSLPTEVSVGGLLARAKVHKWKAPFRTLVAREALLWRMHDLGAQIQCLRNAGFVLGQRILLRSALETLAILIYINLKIGLVSEGSLPLNDFDEITKQLLMGSKNKSTPVMAVNILTALKHAESQHPGLVAMHEHLSESAHPNYDGVLYGYSTLKAEEYTTRFSNQFELMFGAEQDAAGEFVFAVFEHQYNRVWPQSFEKLEKWLADNDVKLQDEHDAN